MFRPRHAKRAGPAPQAYAWTKLAGRSAGIGPDPATAIRTHVHSRDRATPWGRRWTAITAPPHWRDPVRLPRTRPRRALPGENSLPRTGTGPPWPGTQDFRDESRLRRRRWCSHVAGGADPCRFRVGRPPATPRFRNDRSGASLRLRWCSGAPAAGFFPFLSPTALLAGTSHAPCLTAAALNLKHCGG